jgi:hypothetical protein
MRATQLLVIAAQAEKIRLSRKASSLVHRVVFSIAGAVFICWALGFGEYAGYRALTLSMQPPVAALLAAAANLAIAVLFLAIAAHRKRDRLSAEAKLVRDNACREFQNSLTIGLLIKRLFGSVGGNSMSGIALASLVARFIKGLRVVLVLGGFGLAAASVHPAAAQTGNNEPAPAVQAAPPVSPALPPATNETPHVNGPAKSTPIPEQVGPSGASSAPSGQGASAGSGK